MSSFPVAVSSSKSFVSIKEGEGEEETALVTTNDQSTRTSLLKEDVTVDMLCLCARFARIRYEAESWDFPAQISNTYA